MFFRAAQASELVGGADFKHLGARKRPFSYVRHKLLGALKRVHKQLFYGHSVPLASFFACFVCLCGSA